MSPPAQRAVGLITEYNPFHNGHLHHLRESRRAADAEVAVAVMGGHFLQRGEPALCDKWSRTRMALAAGVDVVVELPFPWACNSAPHFAAGAVSCLEALGGVTALCFGSECGKLEPLRRCAELLHEQRPRIDRETAALLRQGVSYPAAREQALRALADERTDPDLLASPNNILGIEYLKALRAAGSGLRPLTIPRLGAGFHDEQAVGHIASATGIRRRLVHGEPVADFLPQASASLLAEADIAGEVIDERLLLRLLTARILVGPDALRAFYQVDNGLEHRLYECAQTATGYAELAEAVKSRQLTRTRVQRVLAYALLGVHRELMNEALEFGPLYLHLLGCSSRGEAFLSATRKLRRLPLVQNFSRVRATLKRRYGIAPRVLRAALNQLEFELNATRHYTLLQQSPAGNLARDFFAEVVRI